MEDEVICFIVGDCFGCLRANMAGGKRDIREKLRRAWDTFLRLRINRSIWNPLSQEEISGVVLGN